MADPTPSSRTRLKADLVLVGLTALWGSTFLVVKDTLRGVDPLSFLTLRFAVGGAALSVWARGRMLRRSTLSASVTLGLFLFGGFVLQTYGLVYTTASRSAFITGLSVVLVPFVSIVLLRRWPSPPSLLGIVLAVGGLFWLTGVAEASAPSSSTWKGDLLTMLCAVSYAFHITLTERHAPRHPPEALVAGQLWMVSILSALALALPWSHPRFAVTPGAIGGVLFCGLFASAGAILGQTWAQARTTAVRAALIYSLEPVFAALYSVLSDRERLGPREVGGGALIVLGVLTAEVGSWAWRRGRGAPSAADL